MTGKQVDSPVFTPVKIGPVTLRNRVIRSAAFENMAYGNRPSQDLYDYHTAVARGGVGMTTLADGFCAVQVARALVRDTDFVNKLRSGEMVRSQCGHSNYCIGRMYTLEMKCNRCVANLPASLRKEVDKAEKRWQ